MRSVRFIMKNKIRIYDLLRPHCGPDLGRETVRTTKALLTAVELRGFEPLP